MVKNYLKAYVSHTNNTSYCGTGVKVPCAYQKLSQSVAQLLNTDKIIII